MLFLWRSPQGKPKVKTAPLTELLPFPLYFREQFRRYVFYVYFGARKNRIFSTFFSIDFKHCKNCSLLTFSPFLMKITNRHLQLYISWLCKQSAIQHLKNITSRFPAAEMSLAHLVHAQLSKISSAQGPRQAKHSPCCAPFIVARSIYNYFLTFQKKG